MINIKTEFKVIIVAFLLILLSYFFVIQPLQIVHSDDYFTPINHDIQINFVGNPNDVGGPYYNPTECTYYSGNYYCHESLPLSGQWYDGYYVNSSKQIENFIYINLETENINVQKVYLDWLDNTVWTRNTYEFTNIGSNVWEINTGSTISTYSGHKYSFDINILDVYGNHHYKSWVKAGRFGNIVRRYVYLNNPSENIEYKPFYLYNYTFLQGFGESPDRLKYDQGGPSSTTDLGKLLPSIPSDEISERLCGWWVQYWFGENIPVSTFTLESIYYHIWWNTNNGEAEMEWGVEREAVQPGIGDVSNMNEGNSITSISLDSWVWHNEYYLTAFKGNIEPIIITDNSVYQLVPILVNGNGVGGVSVISNRSFTSFVIFDIPSDNQLQSMDTDYDGLDDYTELYTYHTNPFLADTDNDGASDQEEITSNTNPNDYTDGSGGGTGDDDDDTGDMDGNEITDVRDIRYLALHIGGNPSYSILHDNGDVNCNGVVNANDVRYLALYLLYMDGYETLYPGGC